MKKIFLLSGLVCIAYSGMTQIKIPASFDFKRLNGDHDLSLSAWGPYSKRYAGISHIPDRNSGMRFDFSVMPGYYRNKVIVPNVRFESGYYPWKVASDLTSVTYRYELEWKDQVYADITYKIRDSASVLVTMHCVNRTALPQNLSLNLMSSIEYPENYGSVAMKCNARSEWHNAVNYQSLSFKEKKPTDNLVHDGWMRAEVRNSSFIDGRAIGEDFGRKKGDQVRYRINLPEGVSKGTISFIYKIQDSLPALMRMKGLIDQEVVFKPSGHLSFITVPFDAGNLRQQDLTLESDGGSAIELNGFVVSGNSSADTFAIVPQSVYKNPVTEESLASKSLFIKYQDIPLFYGIRWNSDLFRIRDIRNDELDIFLKNEAHNHVSKILNGNGKGDYSNIFIRPIELRPFSDTVCMALLACGTHEAVAGILKDAVLKASHGLNDPQTENEDKYILPAGKKYLFSRNMLQASLLSNIVYPIYTQNQYIRHFTPGKWWNSLYTWDLGFTALGLAEVNPLSAIECLNTYVTDTGSQSAFIHHGSPLPVQIYVFQELWNKTQSAELLAYFYPRLKQYYRFLAGHSGSSVTGVLPSHLLKTWSYFYNSGGWDDYPAQSGVHERNLEKNVTPVITTAHIIRVARILRMAAEALDSLNDMQAYDADVRTFSKALQTSAWDSASGYFSYVVHDSAGNASGFFKDPMSGANFNMGLDGVSPLISGICSDEQQKVLIDKIFSPRHMWSPSGITAVDQSAPYYKIDGYWNGSVWMPHQWFVWKTMLDLNRPDLAFKIASKGLDVWKKETDASYYTFEHFLAKSGRGAGWHQFAGLSTPVLAWFSAYYKEGTATAGFETWIRKQEFGNGHKTYKAELSFDDASGTHNRSMLVCMNPHYKYKVRFRGRAVPFSVLQGGLIQLSLPAENAPGTLEIVPV